MLNPPPTNFGLFGGVTDAMRAISCARPPTDDLEWHKFEPYDNVWETFTVVFNFTYLGSLSLMIVGNEEISFFFCSLSFANFFVSSRCFLLAAWHSSARPLSFSSSRPKRSILN